jgi:hypothetical protein
VIFVLVDAEFDVAGDAYVESATAARHDVGVEDFPLAHRCMLAVGKVKRQGQRRSDRGEKQGQRQGQQQVSPLHIRASANVPVEMTPKNKSKVKVNGNGEGNNEGNSRFLHCTFAQARTFRSK